MDISNSILITIAVVFLVFFILWQLKLLMKYSFKFDNLEIDTINGKFRINKREYNFEDVEYVTIDDSTQPSVIERMFSKGTTYIYLSEVIFHMKNREIVTCAFNYKKALYKALCQLKPHVRIDDIIEKYR